MHIYLLKASFQVDNLIAVSAKESSFVRDLRDMRVVLHAFCCTSKLELCKNQLRSINITRRTVNVQEIGFVLPVKCLRSHQQ